MDWEKRLKDFLREYNHREDVIGVLVCGSYITGNPSKHSDLDVHLLLDDKCTYRERGNKMVDGLLIEYFANPYKQILSYFKEDLKSKRLMCQTQFATGLILEDTNEKIKALKAIAINEIEEFYQSDVSEMSDLSKYFLWDMLDDLLDAYDNKKADFHFLYYNFLNDLIARYMAAINRPYHFKSILGNISSDAVRQKYLLLELPHKHIKDLIEKCILEENIAEQVQAYDHLTNEIFQLFGGFDINTFVLRSKLDV